MDKGVRERTDALDAAGNTTAAIGKGFAIGSAALVSLALFGAYVTIVGLDAQGVNLLKPFEFAGLRMCPPLPSYPFPLSLLSVATLWLTHDAVCLAQWLALCSRTGSVP